jgi:hypothetical protein
LQVVGAHYQNEEPGFPTVVLCMSCCWEEQILQGSCGDDGGSAMQLRVPQPGQRLLPPAALNGDGNGGDHGDGGRWAWLGTPARRRRASSGSSGSEEGSSSGEQRGSRRERGGAVRQRRLLLQQMELQMASAGGLLAALARSLDAMAAAYAAPAAAQPDGGSGGEPTPFHRVVLGLVAQAQGLLRCEP